VSSAASPNGATTPLRKYLNHYSDDLRARPSALALQFKGSMPMGHKATEGKDPKLHIQDTGISKPSVSTAIFKNRDIRAALLHDLGDSGVYLQ
jgi:hypothetical protein